MTLVRWSPRTEIESFARDPFFRRFFDLVDDSTWQGEREWYPRMDLLEEKDRLVARLELPGVEAKDVNIHLQGDVLTIHGERKEEQDAKQSTVLKREQSYGAFTRTVQLPYRVQADRVKAQYRNGVMTISLPKVEEMVGRQIPVEFEK